MAEIFPTAPISGASRPAAESAADRVRPRTVCRCAPTTGETPTVHSVMAGTDTDGWLVLRDHPSWGAQVLVERYAGGMEPGHGAPADVGEQVGRRDHRRRPGRPRRDRTDAPVTHYVPGASESGYAGATVRHLLDMRSGIHFSEEYLRPRWPRCGCSSRRSAGRRGCSGRPRLVRGFLISLTRGRQHGGPFDYRSCETDVLGWVIESAAASGWPRGLRAGLVSDRGRVRRRTSASTPRAAACSTAGMSAHAG